MGLRATGLPDWPAGMGRAWNVWAGLGLGQTLMVLAGPGPKFYFADLGQAGFDKLLRAWILAANCGPGLGSNYRPVQGTSLYTIF